ncbi:MAG: hypothetical protein KBD06_04835 [Candidatus Pacebacteria bacterium]|nr:hypothetical protein [Candidatus Paceibacterota bacterium]
MKKMAWIAAFVMFFVGNAVAGNYCRDSRNTSTEFCESVRKSEEALQKVRELLEKADQLSKRVDKSLEEQRNETKPR